MAKYRKKPVVVEAIQFDGTSKSAEQITLKWASKISPEFGNTKETHDVWTGRLICHTLEGPLPAIAYDWIIEGIKGEIYPCKPDVFVMTYEAENDGPPDYYADLVAGAMG